MHPHMPPPSGPSWEVREQPAEETEFVGFVRRLAIWSVLIALGSLGATFLGS